MPQADARPSTPTVYVVDDDPAVLDSVGLLLGLRDLNVQCFATAEAFLAAVGPGATGCLLLDVRLGGADGLAVQAALAARGIALPIVFVTGYGDVATARAAFRAGAVDFLEKPIDEQALNAAVDAALQQPAMRNGAVTQPAAFARRLNRLTAREREVLDLVCAGHPNRTIAATLQLSVRTVEVHKAHLMAKLDVQSFAELLSCQQALLASQQAG